MGYASGLFEQLVAQLIKGHCNLFRFENLPSSLLYLHTALCFPLYKHKKFFINLQVKHLRVRFELEPEGCLAKSPFGSLVSAL